MAGSLLWRALADEMLAEMTRVTPRRKHDKPVCGVPPTFQVRTVLSARDPECGGGQQSAAACSIVSNKPWWQESTGTSGVICYQSLIYPVLTETHPEETGMRKQTARQPSPTRRPHHLVLSQSAEVVVSEKDAKFTLLGSRG